MHTKDQRRGAPRARRASRARRAATPLARVTLDASIQGGKVDDPSVVDAFLPEGSTIAVASDRGTFSGEIHADVSRHVARGTIALRAENMGIAGQAIRLEGDTELTAAVSDWRLDDDTMTVLDARAVVTRAKGSLQPRGAWDFGADRVELSGQAPRLDLARPTLLGIDGRLVVEDAVVPDARSLQTLLPADGILTIESGSAVVSADVRLSASTRSAAGRVDVALARAGIQFHEVHLVGDLRALAQIHGYDSERGLVDLSGSTLEMRNVDATNASKESSRWRGDAVMRAAELRLSPFELDAALTLDADDANPILALALRNDLPGIFQGMTDMPHLVASARLTISARRFAFRDVDARGGGATLRGSYVVRDEHRRAAFVFDTGTVSFGLRLTDVSGLFVRFWGLDGWLREQTAQGLRLWNGE